MKARGQDYSQNFFFEKLHFHYNIYFLNCNTTSCTFWIWKLFHSFLFLHYTAKQYIFFSRVFDSQKYKKQLKILVDVTLFLIFEFYDKELSDHLILNHLLLIFQMSNYNVTAIGDLNMKHMLIHVKERKNFIWKCQWKVF